MRLSNMLNYSAAVMGKQQARGEGEDQLRVTTVRVRTQLITSIEYPHTHWTICCLNLARSSIADLDAHSTAKFDNTTCGHSSEVTCNEGYSGASAQYVCGADGKWKLPLDAGPAICALLPPKVRTFALIFLSPPPFKSQDNVSDDDNDSTQRPKHIVSKARLSMRSMVNSFFRRRMWRRSQRRTDRSSCSLKRT